MTISSPILLAFAQFKRFERMRIFEKQIYRDYRKPHNLNVFSFEIDIWLVSGLSLAILALLIKCPHNAIPLVTRTFVR